jgi:hypothetical protein
MDTITYTTMEHIRGKKLINHNRSESINFTHYNCIFNRCNYNPSKCLDDGNNTYTNTYDRIYNSINPLLTSQYGGTLNNNLNIEDLNTNLNFDINNASDNNIYDLLGGAKKTDVFPNSSTMYMIADATDPSLITNYFTRLNKLGISQRGKTGIKPHISLMEIHINKSNPDHKILIGHNGLINPNILRIMKQQYFNLNPQMYIISKPGGYEIMGDFMAKVYTATNSNYITQFRMSFYKYLESILGRGSRRIFIIANKKYYVYSYRGRDLVAIPDYYHGIGIWKPHLSLVKLDRIQKSNPNLYNLYRQFGINALVHALRGVKGSMNQFNLAYHFNSFRITIT